MGYNAEELSQPFTPCSTETNGFNPAAGLLRVAFHDTAQYDAATRVGGLDASIAFELTGDLGRSNGGPFVVNSLTYLSRYYSDQVSMSDLIAASVYSAVRGCGGPIVPVRAGRIDATQAGAPGVPNVLDSLASMTAGFKRMGFDTQEMIKLTACGHTMGGVHPQLFGIANPENKSVFHFDATPGGYDNAVVVDIVQNKSVDHLFTTGLANSDKKIFTSDNGTTLASLFKAEVYHHECQVLLQRMIELVPGNVQLSEPIAPYEVKPGVVQLSLSTDGKVLEFSGEVRIRTTTLSLDSIMSVEVIYYDDDGKEVDSIATELVGTASGHDDTFAFFGWAAEIDAKAGVSAYTVVITFKDGKGLTYDNNGHKYDVEDAVFIDRPSSHIGKGDGQGNVKVEIVVVVRFTPPKPCFNSIDP